MSKSNGSFEHSSNRNEQQNDSDAEELDSGSFSSNYTHTTNTSKSSHFTSENDGNSWFNFLIPFVNNLQTVCRASGISNTIIELPQIVVVGAQSSGKTSVLESLVQKSFLPRGEGIMTRCPIVLKLINTSSDETPKGEWCEFHHIKDKKYTNFLEVQKVISEHMNEIASNGGGISKTGLQLTIYSQNVVTLTVVDLPGLVKVVAAGQSDDIKTKIRELVMEFITPKNSLILAVSAANIDLENSDGLEMAKDVDPNGDRTLAVLTKLDLAPEPAKLMKVLKGLVIPVKLGIIGVINRSDKDSKQKKSFKDTTEEEQKFLTLKYHGIANQHGTKFLANRLNRLLLTHIEKCFPQLDKKLKELRIAFKEQLETMGTLGDMTNEEKHYTMVNIVTAFAAAYKAQIDGRSRNIDLTVSCGGARIDHIFLVNLINGLRELSPLDAFQELVKIQIEKMRNPVMDCANRVYGEMINMVPQCLNKAANRFPKVNRQITQILGEMLHENFKISSRVLEQYMDIQSSSAITAQADFYELMEKSVHTLKVNGLGKLPINFLLNDSNDDLLISCGQIRNSKPKIAELKQFENNEGESIQTDDEFYEAGIESPYVGTSTNVSTVSASLSREQLEACRVVRELMESFFTIVLHQVQDYVPKSLLFTLVYATVDNVYQELTKKLLIDDKINDLMKESESVIASREAITNDLKVLDEACQQLEILQEKCAF